jgi:hypothetical protein
MLTIGALKATAVTPQYDLPAFAPGAMDPATSMSGATSPSALGSVGLLGRLGSSWRHRLRRR